MRNRLRDERLDDTADPPLWPSEELNAHLSDAVRQACIRMRLIVDALTAECCQLALEPARQVYPLHSRVLAVRNVSAVGACGRIEIRTAQWMWKRYTNWVGTDCRGAPQFVVPDLQAGALAVYPVPSEAMTLNLAVWRVPLESEDMESDGDEPPIPEHLHEDLLDWAEHKAYGKKDSEMYDPQLSAIAESKFTQKFGRLPSAVEMRLWGVSRLQGVPAEFL